MADAVVEAARAALGPVGPFLPVPLTEAVSADRQREAVRSLEAAGYRTTWVNEPVGGKDVLVQVAVLLAATERMTVGTGIANIWARAPQVMHGGAALLAQSFPDRFVLGMGVGYPQQAALVGREFGSPVTTLRDYVTAMATPGMVPAPDVAYPMVIGANGPKLLALAGEISNGAMPAGQPPEFTAWAREVVGPDKLLIVGLPVVADRSAARARVAESLSRPSFAAGLGRWGYSAAEVSEVGHRLVDGLVAHGEPESVAASVRAHLAAGADHVMIMLGLDVEFSAGMARLASLASVL